MLLTGAKARVFQVHVTRRCNLRCTHCYSFSGPEERDSLPFPLLKNAIVDAARLGYNAVGFSGGEPLLRADLPLLADAAHSHGMVVTLVTNGLVFTERRVAELKDSVDMVAISLDGAPERHNCTRGLSSAFVQMRNKLALLRDAGMKFGFVFTLTRDNLAELEWAADFAWRQGAVLFQVHPLELAGRAALNLAGQEPAGDPAARAWLIVQRLRQIYQDKMAVEADLTIPALPPIAKEQALSHARESLTGRRPLGHFLSPLVLEADGFLAPLRFAFPRAFTFGSLHDSGLLPLASAWIRTCALPLSELYGRAIDEARALSFPVINLYEWIARQARAEDPMVFTISA